MIDSYFKVCVALDSIQDTKPLRFIEKSCVFTPVSGIVNMAVGVLRGLGVILMHIPILFKKESFKKLQQEEYLLSLQIVRGFALAIPLIGFLFQDAINNKFATDRRDYLQKFGDRPFCELFEKAIFI